MLNRRHLMRLAGATTLAPLAARSSLAQGSAPWPSRIVKLVVPFTPGGGIDAIGRIIGARLSEMWGQQMVVENKPGAGGNLASEYVARSAPDGYTLYITAGGIAVNRFLFNSINYDPVADFAPVTLICLFPNLLVVPNSSTFRSVGDLLAQAKANPGKITFASPGHGSSPHMSAELFKSMAKVDMVHVPYRGAAPALNDLIAGHIDMFFDTLTTSVPLHQADKIRIMAVAGDERAPTLPDIPTIAESGLPGFRSITWFAMVGPPAMPASLAARINRDVVDILRRPAVSAKLRDLRLDPMIGTPADAAKFFAEETGLWSKVIREANVTVQ